MTHPTDKESVAALVNELKSRADTFDVYDPWNTAALLRRAADALSSAQGDGMRDALVKVRQYLKCEPLWNAISDMDRPTHTLGMIIDAALASHPVPQPDMTDELSDHVLNVGLDAYWSPAPEPSYNIERLRRAIAAIKRAAAGDR